MLILHTVCYAEAKSPTVLHNGSFLSAAHELVFVNSKYSDSVLIIIGVKIHKTIFRTFGGSLAWVLDDESFP